MMLESLRRAMIFFVRLFFTLTKTTFINAARIDFCFLNEPRHEKTGFLHICENKDADQLRGNHEADQRLCFRYTDSTTPLLP